MNQLSFRIQYLITIGNHLIQNVEDGVEAAGRWLGLAIKWSVWVALGLPMLMFGLAWVLSHDQAAYILPWVSLLPVAGIVALVTLVRSTGLGLGVAGITVLDQMPSIRAGVQTIQIRHRSLAALKDAGNVALGTLPRPSTMIAKLRNVLAAEVALGLYLAIVPIQSNLHYLPAFIGLCALAVLPSNAGMRSLGTIGCLVLTCCFFWWQHEINAKTKEVIPTSTIAANTTQPVKIDSAKPCPVDDGKNLLDEGTSEVDVDADHADDCLHGKIVLPRDTDQYKAFIGTPLKNPASVPIGTPISVEGTPDEWVVIQCDGHAPSKKIQWAATQDGELGGAMDRCFKPGDAGVTFWLKGNGHFTVRITKKKEPVLSLFDKRITVNLIQQQHS